MTTPTNRRPTSKQLRTQRGQGMTEYIIVVCLIALAAIGVVTVYGDNIRALWGNGVDALAGEDPGRKLHKAGSRSEHRNLADFYKKEDAEDPWGG